MKRDRLAAKMKADWLDVRRRLTALITQNDIDPDDAELAPVKAMLLRLAINREYVYASGEEEAAPEMIRLRTDSKRMHTAAVRRLGAIRHERGLGPFRGEYEVSKYGSTGARSIPPRFIEVEPVIADQLRAEGWKEPPPWTVNIDTSSTR